MTHAFDSGIDPELLKLLGSWCTDTYRRYIDVDVKHRVKTAVTFAKDM